MKTIRDSAGRNSGVPRAVFDRLSVLAKEIFRVTGGKVISGPFAGMALPETASWGTGDISSKALGCYEQELHESLEKAIERRPDTVINVGSAEGYYAVGMARRLDQARVHAFDTSERARLICLSAAQANRVADRVIIAEQCSARQILELGRGEERKLIIMDCEGAELHLLDGETISGLRSCDVIVECHDFLDRRISPTLLQSFAASHQVEVLWEGARNPAAYPFLRSLGDFDRWLAVCEFRPEVMSWLACWSR